jgi:Rad3-related DNA helicase
MRSEIELYIDDWVSKHIGEFSFRKYQKEAIISIIENIVSENPIHTHIVEAPTGSGKSLIVMIAAGVLAEQYGLWSYILCSDLYLWDQYAEFIRKHKGIDFGMIKGQYGNYLCMINGEDIRNADCRMSSVAWPTLFNKEKAKTLGYECAQMCEYVQARKKAIKSPVCLMTYQLFLQQMAATAGANKTMTLTNRHIIFCDECHNIPEIVQSKFSVAIYPTDSDKLVELYQYIERESHDLFSSYDTDAIMNKYTIQTIENTFNKCFETFCNPDVTKPVLFDALKNYKNLLDDFNYLCEDILNRITVKKQNNLRLTREDIKIFKCVSYLKNHMGQIGDYYVTIDITGTDYMVKQTLENKDAEKYVVFNCTKEDWLVQRFLLKQANFSVLLSATVGGKLAFEENIGIKYTKDKISKYEVIPSTFNFEKSPIFFLNRYKMSMKEKDKSFESLKPIIYNICNKFKDQKGIIQTGTYQLARAIMFYAPPEVQRRLLLYDGSKDKIGVINKHKQSTDTILVGPTLCEGVDLPNDDCRFITILKVPYPSMGDVLVKEKMKLFPLWYNSKTSNIIIQGIGRGVRNENDYCTTYIIDACFYSLYINTKDQYSQELQQRIKIVQ